MPLTKRQWELGIDGETDEWMRKAYAWLSANPDNAYSLDEIVASLLDDAPNTNLPVKLIMALDTLTLIKAVEPRVIAGTNYYLFETKVDITTWKVESEQQDSG